MGQAVLDLLAVRLQADLRTRFPEIVVQFARTDDGCWVCRVDDGREPWGEAGTWFEEDDDLSPADRERLLADVTSNVADNLWPDELTDPWPLCLRHGDHPLQVQLVADRAAWVCLHDAGVAIPVGSLAGE